MQLHACISTHTVIVKQLSTWSTGPRSPTTYCLCYFSPCLDFGINSRVGFHYLWLGIQPQDLRLPNEYTLVTVAFLLLPDTNLLFTSRHYSLLTATWHGSTLLNPLSLLCYTLSGKNSGWNVEKSHMSACICLPFQPFSPRLTVPTQLWQGNWKQLSLKYLL